MDADAARNRFCKIHARYAEAPPALELPGAINVRQSGREVELLGNGNTKLLMEILQRHHPEELHCEALSLEEIFVASKALSRKVVP